MARSIFDLISSIFENQNSFFSSLLQPRVTYDIEEQSYGTLSDAAQDANGNVYFGGTNPATGYEYAQAYASQGSLLGGIFGRPADPASGTLSDEVGLKVHYRKEVGQGDHDNGVYHLNPFDGDDSGDWEPARVLHVLTEAYPAFSR